MTAAPRPDSFPPRFPPVGVRRCIEAVLTLHEAGIGTRTLGERDFRRLLGHESASVDLTRLSIGMRMYGLLTSGRRGHALTDQARRLLNAQDHGEFRSLLFLTTMLPESVRELPFSHTARLDRAEVEQALAAAHVAVRDRKPIFNVLMDNEATLQRERQYGTLYHKVQAVRAPPGQGGPLGWLEGSRRWLSTLAGRTANLTMVALLFAGSLLAVALRPGLGAELGLTRTARAPVPAVPVPSVSVAASQGPGRAQGASPASPAPTALASNQASRSPVPDSPAPVVGAARVIQPPAVSLALGPEGVNPGDVTAAQAPSAPDVPGPAAAVPAPLARGRELTALLFSEQLQDVWQSFRPSVRQEWGSFPAFEAYRQGGARDFGAELSVVSEAVRRSGGVDYYTRTALFERGPRQPWTVIFGLDRSGRVVAFNIVAARVLPPLAIARR